MTIEQIIMAILSLVCTVLGWFARELYGATQSLRKDLSTLEVQINRDYVRYDRLRENLKDAMQPVLDSLSEIKHALNNKIDKP